MLHIKLTHRRRIRQKRRPSLLFVGRTVLYLNAALAIYCSSYVYLKESFGRRSILGGWWFGVVWTGWSSVRSSCHPFLQIILVLNLSWDMEWKQFSPPISSDDLCLLFCLILLLWVDPSVCVQVAAARCATCAGRRTRCCPAQPATCRTSAQPATTCTTSIPAVQNMSGRWVTSLPVLGHFRY